MPAVRIKSEHVARVLDVDRLPEGDPYIVMELIDGTDLDALIERRRKLAPSDAVSYLVQACEGLAEAHTLGMVHRDLKLKNLFLTKRRDGRDLIKVIDFGVVKLAPIAEDEDPTQHFMGTGSDLRAHNLTHASTIVGSVHYMAPEQIRASNVVDARADVWSLGVCLYTMLTGTLPFDGETIGSVLAQIQGRPPRDIREHVPDLPSELSAVVIRSLEKDARRRFQSVGELAAALAPFHADTNAQIRIETILGSGVRDQMQLAATAEVPSANPETQDMLRGRVESTIDAAAVGSLASHSLPVNKRSPLVVGVLVVAIAGGITVAAWKQRTRVAPEPATPVQQQVQAAVTPPPPPPTAVESLPSATASAAPKPIVKRVKPTKAAAKADPKTEPTGAYDKF